MDENIYPHIIATGLENDKISHFYIAVENQLVSVCHITRIRVFFIANISSLTIKLDVFFFQVPSEWTFSQVFDVFFKIHMVFDITFEKNISPTMIFIGHYFYGLYTKEFKPTVTMKNLRDRFPE